MFDIQIVERIVTHGGGAHRDDFMAVCYAQGMLWESVPVERRDPTPEELDDPKVLVLDVGRIHDPARSNFDHHQFDRDAEPECALSLLLKATGDFEDFDTVFQWVRPTVVLDSKGPFALQKELGVSKESFMQLYSPVEAAMLKLFEDSALAPGFFASIGSNLISYMEKIRYQLRGLLGGAGECLTLCPGVSGIFVKGQFEPKAMEMYRQAVEEERGETLAFSICHDDRGAGLSLFRFDDHPRIDFSRLEGHEEVTFAHKSGFIAKTKSRDPEIAMLLIHHAVIAVAPQPAGE